MKPILSVDQLCKTFWTRKKGGFWRWLVPQKVPFEAVVDLTFSVHPGEKIAFIGPNGAGKSTTIKLLTGLLHPDRGYASVAGYVPWKEQKKLAYQFGSVFGARSQLWYRLAPIETFNLLAKIYELKDVTAWQKELVEAFEIGPFLQKSVAHLSLGQRMRCELVASLLHRPKILFLDEPTIGLDVHAKMTIRSMLSSLCKGSGMTLFLTSHDPADIEQVCDRVLLIDQGRLVRDQTVRALRQSLGKKKILRALLEKEAICLQVPGIQELESCPYRIVLSIDLEQISIEEAIGALLRASGIKDLTFEDPPLEEVLRHVYKQA
jgi:ABC-2 type transport system ATP-binding protein